MGTDSGDRIDWVQQSALIQLEGAISHIRCLQRKTLCERVLQTEVPLSGILVAPVAIGSEQARNEAAWKFAGIVAYRLYELVRERKMYRT